jgi:hypothetical protein
VPRTTVRREGPSIIYDGAVRDALRQAARVDGTVGRRRGSRSRRLQAVGLDRFDVPLGIRVLPGPPGAPPLLAAAR